MTEESLLEWETVVVRGVAAAPWSLHVNAGQCVVLCSEDAGQAALLAETALGLTPPASGIARLFGKEIGALAEAERGSLLARVGFACAEGGLVENLKVWENLLLPGWFHGRLAADRPDLDKRVLELLEAADEGLEWAKRFLSVSPDALGAYETRLTGLMRAWLGAPDLLVAESLFAVQNPAHRAKLIKLLGWMRRAQPRLGVLCLHREMMEGALLELRAQPNVTIIQMKGAGDALSEEH